MNSIEINILKIFLSSYIFTFILHNIKTWEYIRISEYIFIVLILYIGYLFLTKKIVIYFSKIDFLFLLLPLLAFILFLFSGLKHNFFLGFISITYFYLIFFTTKIIIKLIGLEFILKLIITLSLLSSILGIIGWTLSQLNIDNILSINSPYPLSIGKVSRASALFTTPSLLAIIIIVGIYFLLIFYKKNKNFLFYSILFIMLLGLILTFSKSIVLFFSFILLLFYNKKKNLKIKFLIFLCVFLSIIFHSIFTSFLFINKNEPSKWMTENFTPLESKPIYQNEKIAIIPTNYTHVKFKSLDIIKNNFLLGVGYGEFKNSLVKEYHFLVNKSPHSSYLGLFAEFGFFMMALYITLLIVILSLSFKIFIENNIQIFIIIFYFIFEGIHTDIHTIKLLWIVIAITVYLYKNRKNKLI